MTMQRYRRRRLSFPSRGLRRQLQWATEFFDITAPATGARTAVNLLDGLESALGYNINNVTVMRFIGHIQVKALVAAVAGDRFEFTWGAGVFANTLVAAAGGSVPDPDGSDYDWLYVDSRVFTPEPLRDDALWVPHEGVGWDIRSKRRINDLGKSLYFVVDSTVTTGSPVISLMSRVLVALP